MKRVHLVKNRVGVFNNFRIGFLDYFIDNNWIREFQERDEKIIKNAKKDTKKARKILNRFCRLDILICHQPPYGILDTVNFPGAPKHWIGKHAGSKIILDYIKKKQPRYVFCGHIHEGKGAKKVGKTKVYNVGYEGDYFILNID
jgi:Icc-related predicted phosphoesterase